MKGCVRLYRCFRTLLVFKLHINKQNTILINLVIISHFHFLVSYHTFVSFLFSSPLSLSLLLIIIVVVVHPVPPTLSFTMKEVDMHWKQSFWRAHNLELRGLTPAAWDTWFRCLKKMHVNMSLLSTYLIIVLYCIMYIPDRTTVRLKRGGGTRWTPTSPSCRLWSRCAAPWTGSWTNSPSYEWLCSTWSRFEVS